jgi:5-methylcytosine-specific restriction endonuclease McrA
MELSSGGVVFSPSQIGALVLNASYEPMHIVNWQKAMILWFQDKVEVLDYHSDRLIHTASSAFRVPSVIRLRVYIKPYFAVGIKYSRQNVFLRDDFTCQYCDVRILEKKLTIDHVLPLSKGGKDEWTNVVSACSKCNNTKADRTPEQANMTLKRLPVKPRWLPMSYIRRQRQRMPLSWVPYLNFKTK